jgi:hypothetical protein
MATVVRRSKLGEERETLREGEKEKKQTGTWDGACN